MPAKRQIRLYLDRETIAIEDDQVQGSFYRKTFLSTKDGRLALSLASYIVGESLASDLTGERFRHGAGRDDVVCSGTLLPDDAPDAWKDEKGDPILQTIWNASDASEVSRDKKRKQ